MKITPKTPEALGQAFVALIWQGNRTEAERILIRDALLNGVIQNPVVAKIIREANYADRKDIRLS